MRFFTALLKSIAACCIFISAQAQWSGDVQIAARFFDTDTARNAANTPFYDWAKTGSETWFGLNYHNSEQHFEAGVRFDAFHNSSVFSGGMVQNNGIGIGSFYVRKKIERLKIAAGYIYEQFGSGSTLRAFENRGLGLDNALVGVEAQYELRSNIVVKAIAGKMKNMRTFVNESDKNAFIYTYPSFVKGMSAEGYFLLGKNKDISVTPILSVVNRTLTPNAMTSIADEINNQPLATRFVPKYNGFVYSLYNTVNYKNLSFTMEYAGKTADVMRDGKALYNDAGEVVGLKTDLIQPEGRLLFGSVAYSRKGFGITFSARDLDHFAFRTSPFEYLNDGIINFLPPLAKQNSLRLPARYQANAQPLDETAFQGDITVSPKKGLTFTANASYVFNDDDKLFQEIYIDSEIKLKGKSWKMLCGFNMVDYNRQIYEQKGKWVNTLTPFVEYTYKFTKKYSLRTELQYMLTERDRKLFGSNDPAEKQDLGDWLYGLAEFNIAPKYSFSVSDMYNFNSKLHYYDISAFYTQKTFRFFIGYAKQVEGIICTGGVCRFEPAFSGVKTGLTATF